MTTRHDCTPVCVCVCVWARPACHWIMSTKHLAVKWSNVNLLFADDVFPGGFVIPWKTQSQVSQHHPYGFTLDLWIIVPFELPNCLLVANSTQQERLQLLQSSKSPKHYFPVCLTSSHLRLLTVYSFPGIPVNNSQFRLWLKLKKPNHSVLLIAKFPSVSVSFRSLFVLGAFVNLLCRDKPVFSCQHMYRFQLLRISISKAC